MTTNFPGAVSLIPPTKTIVKTSSKLNTMKTKLHVCKLLALTVALALLPQILPAASQTWNNAQGNFLWDDSSTNWSGAVWTNGNDAVFSDTNNAAITISGTRLLGNLTANTNQYSFSGGALNLAYTNVAANTTFTITNSVTITTPIFADYSLSTANRGISKSGLGVLTLSNITCLTTSANQQRFNVNAGTVIFQGTNVFSKFRLLPAGGDAATTIFSGGSTVFTNGSALQPGSGGVGQILVTNNAYVELSPTLQLSAANGGNNTVFTIASGKVTTTGAGGVLLNNSAGSASTNNVTVNLNGGVVAATKVAGSATVAFAGTQTINLNGGTFQATANNTSTFFAQGGVGGYVYVQAGGVIIDSAGFALNQPQAMLAGSPSGGLTKLGLGSFTMSGANTYTGDTVVSNGTLNVNGSVAGAVLVKSGATLGGSGSIAGLVTLEAGSTIGAGTSIGTLTLAASPSLASNVTVVAKLNRTNSQTADRITVTGNPIVYSGTLILKNSGEALQVNDTFTVFNASSYSGSFTLVSQTLGQVVTWDTSSLAVDGTVRVATVAPISLVWGQSGSNLTFSWPPNQLGLNLQTNSVSLIDTTNWFSYPGSTGLTNVVITIDPMQTNVFFRLATP